MDEAIKALGPYPILQLIFGVVIFGLGIISILKGLQSKDDGPTPEEQRADWEARRQLENLEQNSWKQVELLQKNLDAINRLIGVIYNDRVIR